MPIWEDFGEYFDADGKPRHGLSKKTNFFGRIWSVIRRLAASVSDFIAGVR